MKILITGALGFVGRHMVRECRATGDEVFQMGVEYEEKCFYCDVRDTAAIRKLVRKLQPEACVHLGGIAFVPMGWKDPHLVFSVNLMGTLNLLDAFRLESPSTRVLVVSSSLIYKKAGTDEVLDEDSVMSPPDIYGVSKIAADLTALGYAKRYEMPVMTARPINHTGPGQSPVFVTSSFSRQLKDIAAGKKKPLMKVGNLESRRDFLDVRDVVRAYRLLIEQGRAGEAYNIASGKLVQIKDVLNNLIAISGVYPKLVVDPDLYRPTDSSPIMSTEKILKDTGWAPRIPLEQTLKDLYVGI